MPPLLVNNLYVSNFNEKVNAFDTFFDYQCSSIDTSSKIPAELEQITNENLFNINFASVDILNILSNLNVNKVHGYDYISIRITNFLENLYGKKLM